jgi:hypothetical protein
VKLFQVNFDANLVGEEFGVHDFMRRLPAIKGLQAEGNEI